MKNPTHEISTDQAKSINQNIFLNKLVNHRHPYFNKKHDHIPITKYQLDDKHFMH